ncbi:MAG: sodium/solute symporter [Lentisphaerae bacterium]|nr:sodium/solute symporter [Lentisphaerota bacterium]
MTALDWLIVLAYFLVIALVVWFGLRQSRDTSADYFLASRHLGWFVIGASIFASNIGSEHLVGLAGSGATDGVAMAHYELHAWCLLVLGWVLVPFYARALVFTMPEFLERRYSPVARWVLSIISLIAYTVTKVAVAIFAGGVVFNTLLPEASILGLNSFWTGSILVIVCTGLYTLLGGMRAVAYTDAVQCLILIFGCLLLTLVGLDTLGGWAKLRTALPNDFFNLWKPFHDPAGQVPWYYNANYPWPGMLFCAPIIGLWYWCTDQYIVQRALGAPNESIARRGAICASFLKLLPVFIFIIPGMIAVALARTGNFPELAGLISPAGQTNREAAQAAFPLLVVSILPAGLRGLIVASLLSALMSSLAGVFNASSTLFTMDIYSKFRKDASEHHLVWVGRLATGAMIIIGLLWIPVIQDAKGLYHYLQSVQGYLAPPIFAVFFFGIIMKRLNAAGCLAALIGGFALGAFRLGIDTAANFLTLAPGSLLWAAGRIYFQYYSLLVFGVSVILLISVSYLTAKPAEAQIRGLTFGTLSQKDRQVSRQSWNFKDVAASVVVLAIILAAYIYFSG